MSRVLDENNQEPDPDMRTLNVVKSNYGPTGTVFNLRWRAGVFHLTGVGNGPGVSGMLVAAKAEQKFVELIAAFEGEGRHVSPQPGLNYAPLIFARDARADGIKKAVFAMAMSRLFADGKIEVAEFGRPSQRRKKIILKNLRPPIPPLPELPKK